jgi:flagellar hook-associated protein 3 FlgL
MSMTISTATFNNDAVSQMDALEASLQATETELSSGSQIQNAADNPIGAAEVNQMSVEVSASTQYVTNSTSANTNLSLEEQALSNATSIMQNAVSLATEANNSALTPANRADIATQLQQDLASLVSQGNTTDSAGNYLFGGYANTSPPFTQSNGTVTYNGSDQVEQVQISANQSISGGDTGATAFMNIPTGNGTFTVSAAATNTGTASIGGGTVTNPTTYAADAATGTGTYTISFTDPSDYQVTDSNGNVVGSGTYTTGDTISFNGAEVTLNGTPAAGDSFTVAPAGTSSAFSALSNLITTLNSTTLNAGQLTTQINAAVQQIQNSVTNFSNVSASVGARINAITASQSTATSVQTTLKTNISTLQDTDYTQATTQLSSEELALQAAQESYASLEKLSLFNYIQG